MSDSTYGLQSTGLVLPRGADIRALLQTRVETELAARGQAVLIDWDRDVVWGVIAVVVAELLGEAYDIVQAVYDARSENNASGVTLADLGAIVGVEWTLATSSTVELTCTGTPGTIIAAGKLARDEARITWANDAAITIGAEGTGAGTFTCQTEGRVLAEAGTIETILTPVSGWTAVTNEADATPGKDQQTDAQFRRTRRESIARGGSMTRKSLRAQILAIDGITGCAVVANTTGDTATVEGIELPAASLAVVVYPDTLTDAVKTELATTIEANTALAGTETIGDESADITTGGITVTVRWQYATPVEVQVRLTSVVVATGYEVSDVLDAVIVVVLEAFDELGLGESIYAMELATRFTSTAVPGLRQATVEFSLDGSTWTTFAEADALEVLTIAYSGDTPIITVAS